MILFTLFHALYFVIAWFFRAVITVLIAMTVVVLVAVIYETFEK